MFVSQIMVTFSDIYEAMRKEKYSEQLQPLPRKFLVEVAEYFKENRDFLSKEEDMFSDLVIKNKKKLENALASFKDLIRLRKKKILNLSFVAAEVGINKKDFENLLGFEKDLFESMIRALETAEKNLAADMEGTSKEERKHNLVRFLEEVPEFLDFEGNAIGPFRKGEIANIEKEIVDIFKNDNRIEILEED